MDILSGMSSTDWKPIFFPITFPSTNFLDKHQKRIWPSSDREERNREVMVMPNIHHITGINLIDPSTRPSKMSSLTLSRTVAML